MKGYRTYIIAFLAVLLAGAKSLGYVTDEMYQALMGLLGAGGLATMRMAIGGTK